MHLQLLKSRYTNKWAQNPSRQFYSKSDYYWKQCQMTVLILQFSAILTELLTVHKIHVVKVKIKVPLT